MKKIKKIINEQIELYSFEKDGKILYFIKPNPGEENIQVWDDLESAQKKSKAPKLIKIKDFLKDLIDIDVWPDETNELNTVFNSLLNTLKLDNNSEEEVPEEDSEKDNKSTEEDKNSENSENFKSDEVKEQPQSEEENKESIEVNVKEEPKKEENVVKTEKINKMIYDFVLDILNEKYFDAKKKMDYIIKEKINIYQNSLIKDIELFK